MIERFVNHARGRRRHLAAIYESTIKAVVATNWTLVFDREEENFDGRVAKSIIQKLLDELDEKRS